MAVKTKKQKMKHEQTLNKEYQQLAQQKRLKIPVLRNLIVAYLVGGTICVIGQAIGRFYIGLGFKPEEAGNPTVATLIFIASVLTGLGVYDVLGQFAGAGTAVPVTGFANSVVSAALEFKREGWVLGIGAKMFSLAGPVITFGAVTAFFIGIIWSLLN